MGNQETISYFENVEKKLGDSEDSPVIDGGRLQVGTRLSKTSEEARMNARIDAMKTGEKIDESETPSEELENIDEKILSFIMEREIKDIFGE